MIRCPRCRGSMEWEQAVYCEDCWEQIEKDYDEGYTASPRKPPKQAKEDLPDMQEED